MSSRVTYRVIYTKRSEKKRKTQLDGYLQCIPSSNQQEATFSSSSSKRKLVLLDASQRVILQRNFTGIVNENEEINLGDYLVDIEEIDTENSILHHANAPKDTTQKVDKRIRSTEHEREEIEELMPESKSDRSIFKPFKGHFGHSKKTAPPPPPPPPPTSSVTNPFVPLSIKSSTLSSSSRTSKLLSESDSKISLVPQLDSILQKKLKPHQIEAVTFILKRLYDDSTLHLSPDEEADVYSTDLLDKSDADDDDDDDDDDDFMQSTPKKMSLRRVSASSSTAIYLAQSIRGTILGDEMGLGKTLTSIACLYSIIKHNRNKKAIVVVPSSLIDNWEKELKRWLGQKLVPLCCRSGEKAESTVNNFRMSHAAQSPLLIISYEMFRKYAQTINLVPNLEVMICDEAHRLKNVESTQTATALKKCRATKRIIISGTLIQNEIAELYSIVDFAAPGLLGSYSSFKHKYADPMKLASESARSKMLSEKLSRLLSLVLIRRSQAEVNAKTTSSLPPRREAILYCFMSPDQCNDYRKAAENIFHSVNRNAPEETFIVPESVEMSEIYDDNNDKVGLNENEAVESNYRGSISSGQVLPGLLLLRKICNYSITGGVEEQDLTSSYAENLVLLSSKLRVFDECMKEWQKSCPADKVVVVSNFVNMLDKVEKLAKIRKWSFLRLDGSVPTRNRQSLVDRFNQPLDPTLPNPSPVLFLLSSKAGGIGINLIGANRLVMVDADWNPATDKQAMARIWREGQTKPVFIYRLISIGTIECSIYKRQNKKLELESLLHNQDQESTSEAHDGIVDAEFIDTSTFIPPRLTGIELEQLIYPPRMNDEVLVTAGATDDDDDDDDDSKVPLPRDLVVQNVANNLGSNVVQLIMQVD